MIVEMGHYKNLAPALNKENEECGLEMLGGCMQPGLSFKKLKWLWNLFYGWLLYVMSTLR